MDAERDYSVAELLRFIGFAQDRGLVPRNSAIALASAVRRMLEPLDEGERADVRELDVDDCVRRLANRARLSPSALNDYRSRVRRAIDEFVEYRRDPTRWRPRSRRGRSTDTAPDEAPNKPHDRRRARPRPSATAAPAALSPDGPTLVFPLGGDRGVVRLVGVPGDLTRTEADRLAAFVRLLVRDDDPSTAARANLLPARTTG